MTQIVTTLDQLVEQSTRYDEEKQDFRIQAQRLFFDGDANLIVDEKPMPRDRDEYFVNRADPIKMVGQLDDNARNQLYDKLAPTIFGKGSTRSLQTELLEKLTPENFAAVMNQFLAKSDGLWMVRMDGNRVRAVLDGHYPRTWNTKMLEAIIEVLDSEDRLGGGFTLDRPYVTADDLHLRGWWDQDDRGSGNFRVGFYFGNGEIGNRKTVALPMIQRHSCQNSIIATDISVLTDDKAGVEFTHSGRLTADAIMIGVLSQMPIILGASAVLIDRMMKAEAEALPSFTQILDGLAIQYGWNAMQKDLFSVGTEGERTVGAVVNGLTYLAQHAGFSEDKVVAYQMDAGDFLTNPDRKSVTDRLIAQAVAGKKIRERV